ncbi:autotransporter outer membrane beta-barrel domain-containing protein, partial [Phyllobacterium phragmitis]|uniref:autotransporter outer membrane beta-barrel domain-containing protein n=1 Tax=Phyllobacterium phragmitis TaxID=2670329 RepID=UPI001FE22EEE
MINSGSITGGAIGLNNTSINPPIVGNAITFTSGTNILELQAGSVITGNVDATAGASNTLVLGGMAAWQLDASKLGTQYTGFQNFQLNASSSTIWTLENTTNAKTPWTLLSGTLSVAADSALGLNSGNLTFDGGTLQVRELSFTSFANTARNIIWGAKGGGFDIAAAGNTFTVSQNILNTVGNLDALTKTGAGTLVLSGANTYKGGTNINAGTLSVSSNNNLGDPSGGITFNGGTLENTNSLGLTLGSGRAVKMTGAGTLKSDSDLTVAGDISGSGAFGKIGDGNLILTGSNFGYTGTMTITGGELHVGTGGATGTLGGAGSSVALTGASNKLIFDRTGALTYDGTIKGDGSVTVQGGLELTLTKANSYKGPTEVVTGSTLVVNGDQTQATGATTVDGTLRGGGTIGGDVTVNLGGTLLAQDEAGNNVSKVQINGALTLRGGSNTNFIYDVDPGSSDLDALQVLVDKDITIDDAAILNVKTGSGVTLAPGIYGLLEGASRSGQFGTGSTTPQGTTVQYTGTEVNLNNQGSTPPPPPGTYSFWDGKHMAPTGSVDGGDGTWQAAAGGLTNWTDQDGAHNGGFADKSFAIFQGQGGLVTVDASKGAINAAGMQFAVDGYRVTGDPITLWTSPTEPADSNKSIIRVGKYTQSSVDMTAEIESQLIDAPGQSIQLVKDDLGTLVLSGDNTYSGGTLIDRGTLSVSAEKNLGAIQGALTFDGGALKVTGKDFKSTTRTINWGSSGGGFDIDDADNTFTLSPTQTLSGAGGLTKSGAGTLLLSGANSYTGATSVNGGTLAANAANVFSPDSAFNVDTGGTLDLGGYNQTLASLTNDGDVRLGNGTPGTTLTVSGDYTGKGGTIYLDTKLEGDDSPTDLMHVRGATSGDSNVQVTNIGGKTAQTHEGIKIIEVDGASNGTFELAGDKTYEFQGQTAMVGGPYAYQLYKGGVTDPADGDWYLRSMLTPPNPPCPGGSCPLYQPGVPIYEAYAQVLQELNGVGTLRQRVGNRYWGGAANPM